ncbi:unnamed protein product, partial [Polarella glacialis]
MSTAKPPDYYKVLGVAKTARDVEIKQAYRKLALQFHPDKNPGNQQQAEERFKEIAEAYSTLIDAEKRRRFDQARDAPPPRQAPASASSTSGAGGSQDFQWWGKAPGEVPGNPFEEKHRPPATPTTFSGAGDGCSGYDGYDGFDFGGGFGGQHQQQRQHHHHQQQQQQHQQQQQQQPFYGFDFGGGFGGLGGEQPPAQGSWAHDRSAGARPGSHFVPRPFSLAEATGLFDSFFGGVDPFDDFSGSMGFPGGSGARGNTPMLAAGSGKGWDVKITKIKRADGTVIIERTDSSGRITRSVEAAGGGAGDSQFAPGHYQ